MAPMLLVFDLERGQGSFSRPLSIIWALFCFSALAQSQTNPDANPWVLNYTAQGKRTSKMTVFLS
jgi:hypothetical protein